MEDLLGLLGTGAAAAIGGPVGALLRLLPAAGSAVMSHIRGKADRAHELEMLKLQAQIAKEGAEQRLREQDNVGYWEAQNKTLDAYKLALEAQGRPSGVPWADALNTSVRPVVTYYFLALYGLTKIVGFLYAWLHDGAKLNVAWGILWTPADTAMLFGILGFWFVDRQLGKAQAQQWNSFR